MPTKFEKPKGMYKKLLVLGIFTFGIAGCAVFQKSSDTAASSASVSYAEHIEPIMKAKCTPCHYPETGKADMLDTYESVRKHINGIIHRVQLDPTAYDYMPYNQKKPAVTAEEVALMQQWKAEGFAK